MTVFISHSSKDKELVKMFCELLTEKLRFDESDIFCTSLDNSLKVGENFITNIRDNLQSRDLAIFLITENYRNSMFCIMEMGAAWAFKNNIVPIIVPPLDFSFFDDTPLKTIQAMQLNNASDIIVKFYENVLCNTKTFGFSRLSYEREKKFIESVDDFVDRVNNYAQKTFIFNLENEILKPIAENGDAESIHISEEKGEYTVELNFSTDEYYPIMSNFMSCVLKLYPHKNWSNTDLNWCINFEACSEDKSVTSLILEIKSGDSIVNVYEEKFTLDENYRLFSIPLIKTKISPHHLKAISEICFVVRPRFVPAFKGKFKIRNIHGDRS